MGHTEETRKRAYEKIKKRRLDWLLENGPCSVCDSDKNLEVDHIDPNSKVSHRIWSWSDSKREEELSKCQVLCRACHENKTGKENSVRMGGKKHGTLSMYRYEKCRCRDCLDAKNNAMRAQRARRRSKGFTAK